MHDKVLYRRSPHLVVYWQRRRLVIYNYATRTKVGAQPIICEVLHFFGRWRSAQELFAFRPHLSRRVLQKLLSLLVGRSLLQSGRRPPRESERLMESWVDWNPMAGFFHSSTKDLEYADLE